jgi:diaminopimelate epimerase
MDFTKMQGASNDFVMVDARKIERDWSQLAEVICDRHLGIGCDSLILLLPSKKAEFRMRIFNADGSEAETCGNGIRCLARYILEKGLVDPNTEELNIETKTIVNNIKIERKAGGLFRIQVNMGKPNLSAEKIPANLNPGKDITETNGMLSYKVSINGTDLTLNLVSMGNPHAVHFTREPFVKFPLSTIGPLVENLPVFPNRINFEVAQVIDKNHLEARVWERGVGETLACGSGACAITVAAKLLGYTNSKLRIKLPGGVLETEWEGDKEVMLSGPTEVVFEGNWSD